MSSEDSTLETGAYQVRRLAVINSSITALSKVGQESSALTV
jgi:hypothetical protein